MKKKRRSLISSASSASNYERTSVIPIERVPRSVTSRIFRDSFNGVMAISRAARHGIPFAEIRHDVRFAGDVGIGFLILSGPELFGIIDLVQVVDARILLRGAAGFGEVGNCDRRQHSDD